jgi:hypothetical protein
VCSDMLKVFIWFTKTLKFPRLLPSSPRSCPASIPDQLVRHFWSRRLHRNMSTSEHFSSQASIVPQMRLYSFNTNATKAIDSVLKPFRDASYMIWYDIYMSAAIGVTSGGSNKVHIYTQTIHRTTKWNNTRNGTYITIRIYTLTQKYVA